MNSKNNIFLTYAIANYNLGASLEHMNSLPDAIASYKKALSIAEEHLGPEHALTSTIKENQEKAQQKLKMN